MIKFEVKNRFSGEVQFVAKINCYQNAALSLKLGLAVKWAVENKADLREADLRWANLCLANLCVADLRGADLREADLRWADLRWADLREADLCWADLREADLREADLRGADLRGADLREADLRGADLRLANLCGADLRWADLREADLLILQTPIWTVYIQKETIRIGCQYHKVSEWENFNDEKIAGMHIDALAWWKKYREPIFALHKTLDGK